MQAVDTLLNFNTKLAGGAANQDYVKLRASASAAITVEATGSAKSIGWDPHEVWRRMIKEPRDLRLNQGS